MWGDVGELLLGLAPSCSKGEEDERGLGAEKGFSPCPTHRAQAQQGNRGQGRASRSKKRNGRKERGEKLGGHKKNPRRRHSKGLKANAALQREQESLGEREKGKKSGMGGKKGS